MSRYIDADKLSVYFEALGKQAEMEGLYNMAHVHKRCLRMIAEAPTADVVEVRHGHWKMHMYNDHCSCGKSRKVARYECSECKRIADMQPYGLTYCPNCGAKMDGKRREE